MRRLICFLAALALLVPPPAVGQTPGTVAGAIDMSNDCQTRRYAWGELRQAH